MVTEIWARIAHLAGPGDRDRLYQVSRELRDAVELGTPVLELPAPRSAPAADADIDDPDPPPQARVAALRRILGRGGGTGLTLRVHGPVGLPLEAPGASRLFAHLLRSPPPEGFTPRAVQDLRMRNLRVEPMARLAMFGNLRALELSNVAGSRDELMAVLRGLPELRRLTYLGLPEHDIVSLEDVIECAPPQLCELSFDTDEVSTTDTVHLTRLTGLEKLALTAGYIHMQHALALTQLVHLELACVDTDDGTPPTDALSRLTRLTTLELRCDSGVPVQHLPPSLKSLCLHQEDLVAANHLTHLTGLCDLTLHIRWREDADVDLGSLTALTRLTSLHMYRPSKGWPPYVAVDESVDPAVDEERLRLPALQELQTTSAKVSDFRRFELQGLRVLRISGDPPHPLVKVVSALQRGGFRGQLVFDAEVDDADEWGVDEWRALTALYSKAISLGGGGFNGRLSVVVPQDVNRERVGVLEDFLRSPAARGARLTPTFKFRGVIPSAFATVSMALALSLHAPRLHIQGEGEDPIGEHAREWLAALRRHGVTVVRRPEAEALGGWPRG